VARSGREIIDASRWGVGFVGSQGERPVATEADANDTVLFERRPHLWPWRGFAPYWSPPLSFPLDDGSTSYDGCVVYALFGMVVGGIGILDLSPYLVAAMALVISCWVYGMGTRPFDRITTREVIWKRGIVGGSERRIPIQELSRVVFSSSSTCRAGLLTDLTFHSERTLIAFLEVERPEEVERALRAAGWAGEWIPRGS
jgi:hypothetical protein